MPNNPLFSYPTTNGFGEPLYNINDISTWKNLQVTPLNPTQLFYAIPPPPKTSNQEFINPLSAIIGHQPTPPQKERSLILESFPTPVTTGSGQETGNDQQGNDQQGNDQQGDKITKATTIKNNVSNWMKENMGKDSFMSGVSTIWGAAEPFAQVAYASGKAAYDLANDLYANPSQVAIDKTLIDDTANASYEGTVSDAVHASTQPANIFNIGRINREIAASNAEMEQLAAVSRNAQDMREAAAGSSGRFTGLRKEARMTNSLDQRTLFRAQEGGTLEVIEEAEEVTDVEEPIDDFENNDEIDWEPIYYSTLQFYKKGGQMNIIPEGALHKNKHNLKNVG